MPAKAKEIEAATVIAETVRTVPTFTIILATTVDVITFCWSCATPHFRPPDHILDKRFFSTYAHTYTWAHVQHARLQMSLICL